MSENIKKAVADALGVFYRDLLEPRFDQIASKLAEHDEKFRDILDHFDQLYQRLTRFSSIEIKKVDYEPLPITHHPLLIALWERRDST